MEKTLTPTRADRLLRVFKRLAETTREAGVSRQLIEDQELHGESIILAGKKLGNFGLSSYLSLGNDPRVKAAAKDAIDRYGASYSSSTAYTAVPLYGELRERLGQIFDASVVLAATTTLGHLAALPVMIRPGERALVDSQSHASVMLATQVLQANGVPISTVPHSDMVALTEAIEEAPDSERVWYLTDGVFSMKGDVAPAEELLALLDEHPNLHIYCDDAHGFGWDGLHGRGQQLRRMGWHERLVVVVGLAKAFGSLGGVIAVPSGELAETIELTGPVLTFGGPIPPPNLGASVASADILLSEELPGRQSQLLTRIRQVNDLGAQMGLPLAAWDETPLWFLDVGELSDMMKLVVGMRDSGFFLNAAAFPVVPQGHAGVRFTVTLDNSPSQIEAMLTQLNDKRLELFGETEIEIDLTGQAAESEVAAEQQTDAAN